MKRRDCYDLNDIYEEVYKIAEENMEKNGGKLQINKDAVKFYALNKPGEMDLYLCEFMDNETFLQAVYLGMFNRMPDDSAVAYWSKKYGMPRFKFRKEVMDRVINSAEFKRNSIVVRNNIYSDDVKSRGIW
ncbi:MAG: DUF4214 domain-containing protein [Lachnospiraceae bacterium]|nr:DUF4214 domain-containing protein [Lachnospiraceae bacterium]